MEWSEEENVFDTVDVLESKKFLMLLVREVLEMNEVSYKQRVIVYFFTVQCYCDVKLGVSLGTKKL